MRVRVGDVDLEYSLDGSGANASWIVLVHCLGGSSRSWAHQVAPLARHHRILTFDLRGQGASSNPGIGYCLDDLVIDTTGLMDAVGIDRASVVGASMGGMVAQLLAAQHPERVARLVVANSTPYAFPDSRWRERAALARADGLDLLAEHMLQRSFTDQFRQTHSDEVRCARQIFCATDPDGFARACEAVSDFDARPSLHAILARTLVIAGAQDEVSPPSLGEEIARGVPCGQLAIVPSAAHLSCVEQPDVFNRLLVEFLAGYSNS
jgi:3-oxoadipate enol-lactonase